MRFTTGWARKDMKSQQHWEHWLSNIKDGDAVVYQQFIQREKGCLGSKVECWRFWSATFRGDRVIYNNDSHPLKNGRAVYWDSDSLHGDVFGSRIVPAHSDIAPIEGGRFVDCHAPVFEPLWDEVDRCFVLVKYGPDTHKVSGEVSRSFPQQYQREVNGGKLHTVFAESAKVQEFCMEFSQTHDSGSAPMFLYSEATWHD
jgi:hypothetical protein